MAALGPEIFSRGFRFNPSPLEAVTYYLPHLVAGATLHEAVRSVVHHADVYAVEPAELARQFCSLPRSGHRFFFTPYKKGVRVAGPGSWNLQSTTAIKDGAEAKVGEIKKFRYKKRGAFTDWLMDEFSTCCLEDAVVGDKQYVFCNIYVSPRAAPDSAAHQESAAFFAPPAAAPMIDNMQAAPKRPAAQSAELPCAKRMRGAVPMAPPVVQPARSRCMASFAPQRPCVPNHVMAPSSTPSVKWPSPGSAQPPAPAPTTCHMAVQPDHSPAPTPPQPRSPPKQQKMPQPTLPEVRAAHMPLAQAPARHCQPQPSVQTKRRIYDPFEAAELRVEEAEEERIAAPDPKESPAALQYQDDDLVKSIEDTVPTAEDSTMSDDEMDQHLASLFENEAEEERIKAPDDPASKAYPAALQDVDLDELAKMLEDPDDPMMADGEVDEFACLLENEIVKVPKDKIPDAVA